MELRCWFFCNRQIEIYKNAHIALRRKHLKFCPHTVTNQQRWSSRGSMKWTYSKRIHERMNGCHLIADLNRCYCHFVIVVCMLFCLLFFSFSHIFLDLTGWKRRRHQKSKKNHQNIIHILVIVRINNLNSVVSWLDWWCLLFCIVFVDEIGAGALLSIIPLLWRCWKNVNKAKWLVSHFRDALTIWTIGWPTSRPMYDCSYIL